ncbi:MAG: hypothetical protein AB1779_08275 [Candidatus Thermoplasmatota archaeon]
MIEMKPRPPVVRTLDAHLYSEIAGEIRKNLPGKVMIEIDRGMDEEGRSVVHLRSKYPEIAKMVIAKVLGEEYIEPEEEVEETERKEWWQRSIESSMGRHLRDPVNLRKNMYAYLKKFQTETSKLREKLYKEKLRKGVY